ncbi:MAG: DUF115 domain-containing protein [Spirochaetales bacterium]|jgi:hypothetical protein|nr:DUF115 domain-containing protein [Spirochaetales bacterium]
MNQEIFDRNILSLTGTDPLLATRLSRVEAAAGASFVLSKTQKPVMTLNTGEGGKALHSLVDPEKEGRRLLETYAQDGFFIFLGFGCAYHILPCLPQPRISQIVILDKNIGLLKSVLGEIDLHALLMDSRVRFLIDPLPEELRSFMLSNYFPSLSGDLRTVSLRPRVEMEKNFFLGSMEIIRESLDILSGDFTVQSRFGKKWFTNTLANLEAAEQSSTVLAPGHKAIVTAAGPSLEDAIPSIREERRGSILIATDTSLPVLLRHDLCPDVVVSIDCQHISYNHFLAGYPPDVPLVLDLASPSVITKLSSKLVFFTSAHPFSQYVNAHWRCFPFIDTSGGNVSHAAVSLSDRLGARQILLYGADFSYPEGKPYAREAYIYPYFRCRENRMDPAESLFVHFLFRNQNTRAIWHNGNVRYTNSAMLEYKERLENSAAYLNARLLPIPGRGEIIRPNPKADPCVTKSGQTRSPDAVSRIFAAGTSSRKWKDFLAFYGESLKNLPAPRDPVMSYIQNLSKKEKDLWATVLPVSTVFVKNLQREKPSAPQLLELSRNWTLETIERTTRRAF